MLERRRKHRLPVDVFFNKYLDGHPHLCRAVDLSSTGLMAINPLQPDNDLSGYSVELRLPGEPEALWLWGRQVRRSGRQQALEFVGLDAHTEQRLERWLGRRAAQS